MLFATILLVASTAVASPLAERAACATGVHIIWARGTTEPQKVGLESPVISKIISTIPGSDADGVVYPASFALPASPNQGVVAMTKMATDYATACPDSKMVFMGYSQGAEVVGDVVSGGGSTVPGGAKTNATPPLPASVMSKVVAIIQFGDPNRVAGPAYNVDTCKVDSTSPRTGANLAKWNSYSSRIQEYCDAKDPVCCSTGKNIGAHLGYFTPANSQAIASFVQSKV